MASAKKKSTKLWTTVTPLSRALALVLFIVAVIGSFYLGIYYQKTTRAGFPNFFCKQWDTICDPDYADPSGYCAAKRICINPSPTPKVFPHAQPKMKSY